MGFKPLILGFSPNVGGKKGKNTVFPHFSPSPGEKDPRGFSHPALPPSGFPSLSYPGAYSRNHRVVPAPQ